MTRVSASSPNQHSRFAQIVSLLAVCCGLIGFVCAAVAQAATAAPSHAVGFASDPPQSFRVLCYHDIRDNLRESFKTWPESTALDTQDLARHFSWLHENGYQPVSLQQIIDARAGRGRLPDKAILLSFDDGYKSVYTKVFPLLKEFKFPALIAIVGEWIQTPDGDDVSFGGTTLPRAQFANWDDLREMVGSGLVEVASHSHGMHKGIPANPQGNLIPAAIARSYNPQESAYESDTEYAARIKSDMQRNAALIERELGQKPRAMVWPYGAYNRHAAQWAAEAGMPITMNLEPGPNTPKDAMANVRRSLITYDTGLSSLILILHQQAEFGGIQEPIERVIHVDLDYVYDADPARQEQNLSRMLDRIVRLRPSTVYLQAYADVDGDGVADALYFPNRHLPMRADLFSRAAWQLRTRAGVNVYAWMPVLAFKLPAADLAAQQLVQTMPGAPQAAKARRYHRLSPFDPLARQTITEIYEDLGKHAVFNGVLFHDDATLSDYEDASLAALAVYRDEWQLPPSIDAIRKDPASRRRWSAYKTAYLNAFTLTLADKLREYQPMLLTARNLYAQPVLDPASEEWFAQNLEGFLASYDYTAIMAMPYMEGAADPERWLSQLLAKVKAIPGALNKTVFELQSRDWNSGKPIPGGALAAQMRQLHLGGARNFGYYPDDFHHDQPEEALIRPALSLETFPAPR